MCVFQAIERSPEEQQPMDSDHLYSEYDGYSLDDFSDIDSSENEVPSLFVYAGY